MNLVTRLKRQAKVWQVKELAKCYDEDNEVENEVAVACAAMEKKLEVELFAYFRYCCGR
jgi:hypothetical protein